MMGMTHISGGPDTSGVYFGSLDVTAYPYPSSQVYVYVVSAGTETLAEAARKEAEAARRLSYELTRNKARKGWVVAYQHDNTFGGWGAALLKPRGRRTPPARAKDQPKQLGRERLGPRIHRFRNNQR